MEATVNTDLKNTLEGLALSHQAGEFKFSSKVIAMGAATALTLRAAEDALATVLALTDNSVITLPKASTCKGMKVRVVAVCADDAAKVSISPNAADAIFGSVVGITGAGAATVVSSGGVTDKDWIMTKTGINKGDHVELVSDGVTSWYITSGVGIQASE